MQSRLKRTLELVFIVVLSVVFAVTPPLTQFANAGYRDGRPIGGCSSTSSKTYFGNICQTAMIDPNTDRGYVLPRRNVAGVWRPAMYDVTDKDTLKAYISSNYSSGNTRLSKPAAFIYHTMLGRSGDQANANGGSAVSAADITEVNRRIDDGNIRFEVQSGYLVRVNGGGTSDNDVKFVTRTDNPLRDVIILRDIRNNSIKYIFEVECANPIGDLAGLPVSNNWTSTSASSIKATSPVGVVTGPAQNVAAYPGDRLDWSHSVTVSNFTTGAAAIQISTSQHRRNGWLQDQAGPTLTFSGNGTQNIANVYGQYTVQASDVGKVLCGTMARSPASYTGGALENTWACATIRSNYSLYPQSLLNNQALSTLFMGQSLMPSNPAQILEQVINTGPSSDVDSQYATYEFKIPSGSVANIPSFFQTTGTPGANVGGVFGSSNGQPAFTVANYASGSGCSWLASRPAYSGKIVCTATTTSGTVKFPGGIASLTSSASGITADTTSIKADNYAIGDTVCRIVAVSGYDYLHTSSSNHRISYPGCVTIGKRPLVQVWGGDIRVGAGALSTSGYASSNSSIIAQPRVTDDGTYGSWGEYSLLVPLNGRIDSASAATTSGKTGGAISQSASSRNVLSFANTATPYGKWGATGSFPNIVGAPLLQATAESINPNVNINSLGTGVTNAGATSFTLSGTLAQDRTVIVRTTGTVTIDANLKLGNSIITGSNVAQIIVIAGNIIIQPGVTQVDAWLIAQPRNASTGGMLSTCGNLQTPYYLGLSATSCNTSVRINGPIMARELQLRRTYGAERSSGGVNYPAEIINFRPDAFLWELSYGESQGSLTTVSTRELPPRY